MLLGSVTQHVMTKNLLLLCQMRKKTIINSCILLGRNVIFRYSNDNKHKKCVAVGQDKQNKTFSVFLK